MGIHLLGFIYWNDHQGTVELALIINFYFHYSLFIMRL